jgi:uncharacterized damage-inducible protein DinB
MKTIEAEQETMQITEGTAGEFRSEAQTTERVLQRVPKDKLGWKPHPKSLSLGQLALHVAAVPGNVAKMLENDEQQVSPDAFRFAEPKSTDEILATFKQSTKDALAFLNSMGDEKAARPFTLKHGDKPIFTMPRMAAARMIMMSHVYHHRGQLAVYLRMLDVPVPSIYGPSADENPFA